VETRNFGGTYFAVEVVKSDEQVEELKSVVTQQSLAPIVPRIVEEDARSCASLDCAPEYEICLRIVMESFNSMCRTESPCELIISLRSLTGQVKRVVVSVEATDWVITGKYKVVQVKENGLGQTSFSIVPKCAGFLPYPTILVYGLRTTEAGNGVESTTFDSGLLGGRVALINRSEGKHILVVGQLASASDTNSSQMSLDSVKKELKRSFKTQAKEKLQRLFE